LIPKVDYGQRAGIYQDGRATHSRLIESGLAITQCGGPDPAHPTRSYGLFAAAIYSADLGTPMTFESLPLCAAAFGGLLGRRSKFRSSIVALSSMSMMV